MKEKAYDIGIKPSHGFQQPACYRIDRECTYLGTKIACVVAP